MRRIAALLTGRGNNSLKDKNILDVLGHPVLYYPARAGRKSKLITDWYCSSDDPKILQAAFEEGYERILRPAELALPTAQHIDCIRHALSIMDQADRLPDILVVLLANNVTVSSQWIDRCIQMMLEDEDYLDGIKGMIRDEQVNAEYAVSVNGQNFSDIFASMDDDYMKERAADVKDISARVVRILAGVEEGGAAMEEPSILVAEDLAPSETLQLDRSKVLAFVTRKGSTNSHTAILARTMNIPALVMVSEAEHVDGLMGIVDGKEGKLIVEPDEETIKSYQDKLEAQKKEQELLNALKGKPSVTKDGRKVNL